VRNPQEMSSDPYRTLGVQPGASMAEVKRAYRRLAKAYHPDSAGEVALPRFLAIHAAYELLRTGRPLPGPRPNATAPGPAAEPWRADPERARAARERARTARAGRSGAGGQGTSAGRSGSAPGRAGSTGANAGQAGPAGPHAGAPGASGGAAGPAGRATGTTGGAPSESTGAFGRSRTAGGRRETRKATLGSTSYDDARDPGEATWSGASWYGPTTGEYWIINPREYADPRKHGPDYQSRARRPLGANDPELDGPSVAGPDADDLAFGTSSADSEPAPAEPNRPSADRDAPRPEAASRPGPRMGERRWSSAPTGADWDAGLDPRTAGPRASAAGAVAGGTLAAARRGSRFGGLGHVRAEASWPAPPAALGRDWFRGSADDPIRRLGVALVAWPPIGLAAAAAIGELTGCSTYSAECGGADALLPWLAQAGILGLLLLLPSIARVLAVGAVAVVLALVPITGFLVVVGASGAPEAGFALAFMLSIAWLGGVAWSMAMTRRRSGRAGLDGGGAVP
jgi:DnaJ domain